jgi:hypothetical protein
MTLAAHSANLHTAKISTLGEGDAESAAAVSVGAVAYLRA